MALLVPVSTEALSLLKHRSCQRIFWRDSVFFPWDSGTIILEMRSRMRELRSRHRNKRKLASFAEYPGCAPARLIRGPRRSAPSRLELRRTQSGRDRVLAI